MSILIKAKTKLADTFKNFVLNTDLIYITENANWSTDWDGYFLVKGLRNYLPCRTSAYTSFIRNKIIHFGSVNTLIRKNGIRRIHPSNKTILTWFHIVDDDKRLKYVQELNRKINIVHTSSRITRDKLIDAGLHEDMLVVIPLGIDLDKFVCKNEEEKKDLRNKLGLPQNKIIIGSFQKDGIGWGQGLEPKLEKGPDIFCNVIEKINKEFDIHVLLTGPARGYVKRRLGKAGIPYTHKFLQNYLDIVDYYNVLDIYLVTSRAEGGPKAILESIACGVPVVSTKVGMAPEVIVDGENGYLCEVEAIDDLINKLMSLLKNKKLENNFIQKGFESVRDYSWDKIAEQYYEKMYSRL